MKNYISVDMAKAVNAIAVDGKIYEDGCSEIPNGKEIEYGYKIHFDTGEECFCDAADLAQDEPCEEGWGEPVRDLEQEYADQQEQEKKCEECCGGDDCFDSLPQTPYNPADEQGCCCPDCEDYGDTEKSEKPLSIVIKENENGAFEINVEGTNDKVSTALEVAISSVFISECESNEIDMDLRLLLADNMAARIGRGVRSMILSATGENTDNSKG